MRVFVHAPQSAAAQLMGPGAMAVISFGGQGDKRFEGKVTRTAKAIDPQSRTLRVEIDVPNADHALVPGMYVQVSFKLTGGARIQVPAAALLFRSGGPQVAVSTKRARWPSGRHDRPRRRQRGVDRIGAGRRRQGRPQSQQPDRGRRNVKLNPVDNGDTKSASSAQ